MTATPRDPGAFTLMNDDLVPALTDRGTALLDGEDVPADALRLLREEYGMSRAELARRLGVSPRRVRSIEAAPFGDLYVSTIARYLHALELEIKMRVMAMVVVCATGDHFWAAVESSRPWPCFASAHS